MLSIYGINSVNNTNEILSVTSTEEADKSIIVWKNGSMCQNMLIVTKCTQKDGILLLLLDRFNYYVKTHLKINSCLKHIMILYTHTHINICIFNNLINCININALFLLILSLFHFFVIWFLELVIFKDEKRLPDHNKLKLYYENKREKIIF